MREATGRVIWITGLSGSGKTTLANALLPRLPPPRLLLDGDEMREALSPIAGGYDVDSRKRLAHTYARLCKLIASQGTTVVCATISMFHEVREWNRLHLPNYCEVYLEASEAVLKERDFKKIYRETAGQASHIVGQTIPPELPKAPDIRFQQGAIQVEAMADAVLEALWGKSDYGK